MYKARGILQKGLNFVFSAIFVVFTICLLINSPNYCEVAHFNTAKILLFAACIAGVLFLFCFIVNHNTMLKKILKYRQFIVLAIVLVSLLVVQIAFIRVTYTPIGWDCSAVILQADMGKGFDSYFLRYPNNVLLCVIYRILFRIAAFLHIPYNCWFLADLLNVFFIDTAILMGALVCNKVFSIKSFYFFLFFSAMLVGLSPYMTVPYSDTAAMPFTIAIIYCGILFKEVSCRWKKGLLGFLIGFLTFIGCYIKPTVLIAFIALLIYLLLHLKKPKLKPQPKQILSAALCGVLFVFGVGMAFAANQKAVSIINNQIFSRGEYGPKDMFLRQVPLTHHIMIGLKDTTSREGTQYGGFNSEDNLKTTKILGETKKIEYHLAVIKQRLSSFGVKGLFLHLFHKAVWISTDGTFYYGGEGVFHYKMKQSKFGIRGLLQNFTYAETPFYQQYDANYQQGLWAIILLLLAFSFFVRPNEKQGNLRFVLQLSIIGLLLFLLIFEARARYLILFLPFYLLIACDNLAEITNNINCFNKAQYISKKI